MNELDFVDPHTTPFVKPRSRGELHPLYKEGGTYFVTFRLWDPVTGYAGCTESKLPTIVDACDPPLKLGSRLLADPHNAGIVRDTLLHFDGERYVLLSWCVMPNHVHVVFHPLADYSPSSILHSWKSYSSHRINQLLGRKGNLWERESFDHLVRCTEDLEKFNRYVEMNPVEAGRCSRPQDWLWSSAAARLADRAQ